jgi:hypothetical protein
MQHGIRNINEFYTNNYWDETLSKDLGAKFDALTASDRRIKQLKDLERTYWDLKESATTSSEVSPQLLEHFYREVFKSLNLTFAWQKQTSIDGGSVFATCSHGGNLGNKIIAFLVDHEEAGAFESMPILGEIELEGDEHRDERIIDKVLDEELLASETPSRWALVCAWNSMYLIERSKWPAGRYIEVQWEDVFFQRKDDIYKEILSMFSREHLAPDSGTSIHDDFNDASHRKAHSVTTALREAVRQSIEDLINEMVYFRRQSHAKFMPEGEAQSFARELTHDALFYVYRLIFLLFVEAQSDDESDLLPLKSELYRQGYSIEKLVEICQRDLIGGGQEADGYFFHESLEKIFALIWQGYDPPRMDQTIQTKYSSRTGFFVRGMKADLFDPAKTKQIGEAKFRNVVLQQILKRLAFAKGEGKKAQYGRVSYSALSINALGAVYEGLLSYTGYFAKEPLIALKPAKIKQEDINRGKDEDQIFLAPKKLVETYKKDKTYKLTADHIVMDPDYPKRELEYPKGSFIYRMAGRDRQKLASYYTPEELTKLTVKYALKVLFENKKTPEELLNITILEPAMGSGAFLAEAVNQLSAHILELEKRPSAERTKRLNEIKYHLISNCVYGVDFNSTAIELARFSLWLNCIGAKKHPPTFEGRLKQGNSLIGARFRQKSKDGIFPWLLLDKGMASYGDDLMFYDAQGALKLKAFATSLQSSALDCNHSALKKSQHKAAELYDKLRTIDSGLERSEISTKIRDACDLWCSMFFLRPEDTMIAPKTHNELLEMINLILTDKAVPQSIRALVDRTRNEEHPFHWEIEFPDVFEKGGFDLILANPPWVAISWDDQSWVEDKNQIPAVLKLDATDTREFIKQLNDKTLNQFLGKEYIRLKGYTNLLEVDFYSLIDGSDKNTYKAFDVLAFEILSKSGSFGVIQEDGVLYDDNSAKLRREMYSRYRFHFQFQNDLNLFADVSNKKRYSANFFGSARKSASFTHVGNLFVTRTVELCLGGESVASTIPLIKNEMGSWETRGHHKRAIQISEKAITLFAQFLNYKDKTSAPLLNLHSVDLLNFVEKIALCTTTIETIAGSAGLVTSPMWNETAAKESGWIRANPNRTNSVDRLVLSGPNINVGTPLSKNCREKYTSNKSYDLIELATIEQSYIPRTLYEFTGSIDNVNHTFPTLDGKPYRSFYRIATRDQTKASNTRCLFGAIIPPGVIHINAIVSAAFTDHRWLLVCAGYLASIVTDSILRLQDKGHFYPTDFNRTPVGNRTNFFNSISRRALVLNCLTTHYSDLWSEMKSLHNSGDALLNGKKFSPINKPWTWDSPLRKPEDREQALVEIDALVSLSFDLTADELVQVYEILFPVMANYDRKSGFDRKGKLREAHKFFKERGW